MAPVIIDRMMTAPNALASFALTVNLIVRPRWSSMMSVEDAFQIRNDNELVTPLRDEADELRPPVHADARRLLHIDAGNFSHLVDLVGDDADQDRIAVDLDLDDDDAGVGGVGADRHAEADAQIG